MGVIEAQAARMKLAAALIATLIVAVSGQAEIPECECGMFITTMGNELEVHRLPPFDIDNCNQVTQCKRSCAGEYDTLTNGGDLNYVLGNGYTVGQDICLRAYDSHGVEEIHHETVYGYARHCKGPWDFDGETSIQHLCCYKGLHYDCNDVTGVPGQ